MSKATVYRFSLYQIATDSLQRSRRWATRDAIVKLGGEIDEGSGIEVDTSVLGEDIPGMTARGYTPQAATDFQRQVNVGP